MKPNWQEILVKQSTNISEVMKIIDSSGLMLALVIDNDRNLIGTVTDGDIRRALIGGAVLSTQVSEVMNKNPTTAVLGTSRKELFSLMEKMELLSIPILDLKKVVGLETLQHVIQKRKYQNPVFLMAGGFGTRLKPLTDNCPKPLLKVGDKPILETVLLSFIHAGFHKFYISTHYLPEMIRDYFGHGEKWGVCIEYVHETDPLGTGGALGLLPSDITNLPIIVMNGDVLTKVDLNKLLEFHNENNAIATMCVREYEYQVPFGVVESDGHKIVRMNEKPIQRFHVNAGIYVIDQEIIKSVTANERIDMPTLIEKYIGKKALVYPFYEYWLDIGRIDDFKRAQIDIQTLGF